MGLLVRYATYITEELAYVFFLCVCFIHIWLGSGVAIERQNTKLPPNPTAPEYWTHLFRISVMLTVVNAALLRAFPTSHGSLHNSLYMMIYQAWGVNIKLIDTDNHELAWRILGGVLGVGEGKGAEIALGVYEQHQRGGNADG